MFSKADLEKILELEKKALGHYNDILSLVSDERVVKDLTVIRNDEIKHVQIAERILELVYKLPRGKQSLKNESN